MPSPNTLKDYVSDATYHIFNHAAGEMNLFYDEQDYKAFLYYLRIIFTPARFLQEEIDKLQERFEDLKNSNPSQAALTRLKVMRLRRAVYQAQKLNFTENIELLSYCLMPNHFHLVVFQKIKRGIEVLMRRLASGFSSGYLKRKYGKPRGSVFEGVYKASHLYYEPELQTLVAGRYAERNPLDLLIGESPRSAPVSKGIHDYPYSSLRYYILEEQGRGKSPVWLNTERLTQIFNKIKARPNSMLEDIVASHKSYPDFVLNNKIDLSLEDVRLAHLEGLL